MAARLIIAWLLIALLGSGALVVVWRVATRNARRYRWGLPPRLPMRERWLGPDPRSPIPPPAPPRDPPPS